MQMAESDLPSDPRALKRELKRLAHEEKMKKKQLKRERKMQKMERKKSRKEAVLRAKLAKRGISVPKDTKATTKAQAQPGKEAQAGVTTTESGAAIPEAEIISEADKWTPQSAKKIDEIKRMIDRMDHTSVKSLKDRYKERYGEDLEVPDVYESRPSIEVETAEHTGELEPISSTTSTSSSDQTLSGTSQASAVKPKRSLFGGPASAAPPKPKVDRPLRLLDYRTPMYLRDTYGATGGKGKRLMLTIVDILLNILLGIVLIKVIMTLVYIMKDRKLEKQLSMMEQEASQAQPTS
jgi:hypothetical protein